MPDIVVFSGRLRGDPGVTAIPLAVVEVLSPEDTMMHVLALDSDYRRMVIPHIWIIEPRQKIGWRCETEGWHRTETFRIPGVPLALDLRGIDFTGE